MCHSLKIIKSFSVVIVINRLILSLLLWPKMITLSGFYCTKITNCRISIKLLLLKYFKKYIFLLSKNIRFLVSKKFISYIEQKFISYRAFFQTLKLRCDERFTHAFTACGCVFNEITLVGSNQGNYFENENGLGQTKVITLKTKMHAVNASWKRLSQRSFS